MGGESSFPLWMYVSELLFAVNMQLLCFRRPGGARIYGVFDNQLPAALVKLPFDRHLSFQNVRKVVSEADGYQPHLIAPEQGYRRLIDSSLNYFRGPAEASVDAVSFLALCFCLDTASCQLVKNDVIGIIREKEFQGRVTTVTKQKQVKMQQNHFLRCGLTKQISACSRFRTG